MWKRYVFFAVLFELLNNFLGKFRLQRDKETVLAYAMIYPGIYLQK
jgi:hypothetical protein